MDYTVAVLMTERVTRDVRRYIVERPEGFEFQPGQAVMLALNEPGWEKERRPFTPTSLPEDRVLEFTIKSYPAHAGFTDRLNRLVPGDELQMSQPFGTLTYKGPGTFIAGGAGLTPFMAMIRALARDNALEGHRLILSNKTPADIICPQEFRYYLEDRCQFLCTRESGEGCVEGRLSKEYLAMALEDFDQHFYTCGPPQLVETVTEALKELGARPEQLLFES